MQTLDRIRCTIEAICLADKCAEDIETLDGITNLTVNSLTKMIADVLSIVAVIEVEVQAQEQTHECNGNDDLREGSSELLRTLCKFRDDIQQQLKKIISLGSEGTQLVCNGDHGTITPMTMGSRRSSQTKSGLLDESDSCESQVQKDLINGNIPNDCKSSSLDKEEKEEIKSIFTSGDLRRGDTSMDVQQVGVQVSGKRAEYVKALKGDMEVMRLLHVNLSNINDIQCELIEQGKDASSTLVTSTSLAANCLQDEEKVGNKGSKCTVS